MNMIGPIYPPGPRGPFHAVQAGVREILFDCGDLGANAYERARSRRNRFPEDHIENPTECRIWLDSS
jgi:hypothetical protein